MSLSTACRKGHPWTPDNTIERPGRGRECRACSRERRTKWATDKRAQERAQRPEPVAVPVAECSVESCPEAGNAGRGWCNVHYQRWYRYGDPLVQKRIRGDDSKRFWSKVDKNGPIPAYRSDLGPCWIWQGALGTYGYAQVRMGGRGGKMVLVHRWSYEQLVGEIAQHRQLDHLCRVRHCVNPAHLEPVPGKINTHRGMSPSALNLRKTHCLRGHPFNEENTRWVRGGGRSCRTCQRENLRKWRETRRNSAA